MRKPSKRTTDAITDLALQSRLQGDDAHVDDRPPEVMTPEHREMVLQALEEARNGQFATDEEVRATFARFRL